MIKRLVESLENRTLGPVEALLILLSFILVRLVTETLYLDPGRSIDFFVFNIWYFISLLLAIVLLSAALTGQQPRRVFNLGVPCAAVILVPLLDRFFYPHLTSDQMLALCRLPIHPRWTYYVPDFWSQVLAHRIFLNPGISLGLRLEVFLVSLGVGLFVYYRSPGRVVPVLKGIIAYAVCLCVIYAHALLVVHPATRRWVFVPAVLIELALLLAIWNRAAFGRWFRNYPWPEVLILAGAASAAFFQPPLSPHQPLPQMGKILAGGSALLWLGLFLGQAKKQEAIVDGNHVPQPPEREALLLTLAACLLAGYLTGESFFVAAAMIAGLGFLAWLSSLRIARSSLAYSLLAALSVWTIAWAGYDAGHNSLADFPHPPPPGMPGFQGQQFAGYVPPGMAGEMPAFSGGFDINALDFLSGQPSGPPVFPPGFSPSGRQVALPAWISHPLWLALPATIWAFRVVGRRREKSPVAPTWNELLATDPHLNSRR